LGKIGTAFSETFGGISQFLPYRLKSYNLSPRYLGGYLIELHQICRNVDTILLFNILKSELR